MKHVLFICSQNKLRSPTAEQIFKNNIGIVTLSAGTELPPRNWRLIKQLILHNS